MHLDGHARYYFDALATEDKLSYNGACSNLAHVFQGLTCKSRAQTDMRKLSQSREESIGKCAERVYETVKRATTGESLAVRRYEMLQSFVNGLKRTLRLAVKSAEPKDFGEALQVAGEVEQVLAGEDLEIIQHAVLIAVEKRCSARKDLGICAVESRDHGQNNNELIDGDGIAKTPPVETSRSTRGFEEQQPQPPESPLEEVKQAGSERVLGTHGKNVLGLQQAPCEMQLNKKCEATPCPQQRAFQHVPHKFAASKAGMSAKIIHMLRGSKKVIGDSKALIAISSLAMRKTLMDQLGKAYRCCTKALIFVGCLALAGPFEKRIVLGYRWCWNPGIDGRRPKIALGDINALAVNLPKEKPESTHLEEQRLYPQPLQLEAGTVGKRRMQVPRGANTLEPQETFRDVSAELRTELSRGTEDFFVWKQKSSFNMQHMLTRSKAEKMTATGRAPWPKKKVARSIRALTLIISVSLIRNMGQNADAYDWRAVVPTLVACLLLSRAFEKRITYKHRWCWNPGIEGRCPRVALRKKPHKELHHSKGSVVVIGKKPQKD